MPNEPGATCSGLISTWANAAPAVDHDACERDEDGAEEAAGHGTLTFTGSSTSEPARRNRGVSR